MKPLHRAPTRPQRAALVMSRPPLQAWCPPLRRRKVTPPCPQPLSCTTPVDTVRSPPISVSGTCRTLARAKATHTLSKTEKHWTIRHENGTRARERHTHFCLFYILSEICSCEEIEQRKYVSYSEYCKYNWKSPLSHWL